MFAKTWNLQALAAAVCVAAWGCFVVIAPEAFARGDDARQPSAEVVNIVPMSPEPFSTNVGINDVQINAKTGRVYVSNNTAVTVLDGDTDAIIKVITVPAAAAPNVSGYNGIYQSCVDDRTNTVYSLSENGVVTVIDGATNRVTGSFAPWPTNTVTNVDGMVCNPETGKLYMILYNDQGNHIVVWDTRKHSIAATIFVTSDAHEWMAVNRKTNRIYAQTIYDGLVVIDGATDTVIDRIAAGQGPQPPGCLATNSCASLGSWLDQVAVDENTNRIYVVGINDGSLTTIDGATDKVIALDFFNWFTYSLALDPVRKRIYQLDVTFDTVSVIDSATGKRTANLGVGPGPFPLGCNAGWVVLNPNVSCLVTLNTTLGSIQAAAVNPVTGKIYVGYGGMYVGPGSAPFQSSVPNAYSYLYVLKSTETRLPGDAENAKSPQAALVATATLAAGAGAIDAAFDVRADKLYVANSGANSVSALSPATGAVTATISVGASPRAIAIDQAASTLYTYNGDGSVSVLDGAHGARVTNFPADSVATGVLGLDPQGLAHSRRTGKLYAVNGFTQIDVIDPSSRRVLKSIPDPDAGGVAINQRTNTIYVSQFSEGTVWVIDGATDRKIGVIGGVGQSASPAGCYQSAGGPNTCLQMSSGLTKVAIDEELNRIYVLGQNDGRVVTIDGETNTVLGVDYVQPADYGLAVDPKTHTVFVSNFATPALWLFDGRTGRLGSVVNLNSRLCDTAQTPCFDQIDLKSVTVNPVTGRVFALDQGDLNPQNTSQVFMVDAKGGS
jgi:YVTN family beta-propeller protein